MATSSWNTGSGDFDTGTNWSPSGPPGADDTALFDANSGTVSGNGTVATLQLVSSGPWAFTGAIEAGGIIINNDVTVFAGGSFTLTGSTIVVAGGPSAIASLSIGAGSTIGSVVQSTVPAETATPVLIVGTASAADQGNGTISLSSGSVLDLGGNAASIGAVGTGTLNVLSGSVAKFASADSDRLAALAVGDNGDGTITISGIGSEVVASGAVSFGHGGTGTLIVYGGATFTGGSAASGSLPAFGITLGDGGQATAGDQAATLGGTGSADVLNGTLQSLGDLRVGYDGASGNIVASGSTVGADGMIIVGGGTDRLGGVGTVSIQSGSIVRSFTSYIAGVAGIVLGADPGTAGSMTVTGASSTAFSGFNQLVVGGSGSGTLTVSYGSDAYAGTSGYTDAEAALAVAAGTGSTGSVTVTGAGTIMIVFGLTVIGGNDVGAGVTQGGVGTLSVTDSAYVGTGAMTIEAHSSLIVDQTASLIASSITINGGTADLYALSASAPIDFGTGGTLGVHVVSGANTVGNFTFGDVIDFEGTTAVTLSGNVVTGGGGSITLAAAPADASYQLLGDGNGGTFVALEANTVGVYRFFDQSNGTHFYTADADEKEALTDPNSADYRPDLIEETNGFGAIDPAAADRNEVSVYRFFDQITGSEFLTASASERDAIMNPDSPDYQASYVFEPGSTFFEHGTQQVGDVAVYRFFDSVQGTHFYTGDPAEYAAITTLGSAGYRPDLVSEGVGFYAPAGSYGSA